MIIILYILYIIINITIIIIFYNYTNTKFKILINFLTIMNKNIILKNILN